jgi:hypothetical protein
MQRRLSVKDDPVFIIEVSFHNISKLKIWLGFDEIQIDNLTAVFSNVISGSWPFVSSFHELSEVFDV